jgi:hypothetical protein
MLHPTLRLRLCTSQHDHGGKKLQVETYALHKKSKNSGAASHAQYRSLSTSVSQLNSVRILNPNRKPGCSGNLNSKPVNPCFYCTVWSRSKPVKFPVCPVLIGSCVGSIEWQDIGCKTRTRIEFIFPNKNALWVQFNVVVVGARVKFDPVLSSQRIWRLSTSKVSKIYKHQLLTWFSTTATRKKQWVGDFHIAADK